MALERRQREAGLLHQIGVGGPDDRAPALLPVLRLRKRAERVEEHHVAGLEADMRADPLHGHEGTRFRDACTDAVLCMTLRPS